VLSNDKDFKLKDTSELGNIKVINSKEFDAEFKESVFFNIQQSQKFCEAITKRNIDYAKKLLDPFVNINYVESEFGYTPLIHAVRNRDISMIEWLLSIPEIDINQVDEKKYKFPPISHAIQINNARIVKLLIQHGANVNEPSLNGRNYYNTPLMIASWGGNLELVKILVENGACINQADKGNGFTALIKAVFKNNPEIVEYLLAHNADKTICSFEKMTALDYAYSKNENGDYEKIIELLNLERRFS
jgi:ankyrin repeat protein